MNLRQVLDHLTTAAVKSLSAEAATVVLREANALTVAAACGDPPGDEPCALLLAQAALEGRSSLLVEDAANDPQAACLRPHFQAALVVPLELAGEALGTLQVYGARPRQFSSAQAAQLHALADLGADALQAARGLAELERIEASKSQFIRVATHELRSPVTVAQSLVRMVVKGYAGPLGERQQEIMNRISGRLNFLESLVNDLLDLAASKSPELTGDEGPVAINGSVGRAVLLQQPRAEEKHITLALHPCCEELVVWANEEGLDRIFSNLVGNAVKYTPNGGQVTVSFRRLGDEICVVVADTGIGIPPEGLEQLFTEFYRAPNARGFAVGTGLGLSIVKDLVERYRGRIAVESTVDQGTTFTVSLPVYGLKKE